MSTETRWELVDTTVRRHPRTLVEAFPRTPEYGCAIERPRPFDWQDRVVMWGCVIAFFSALAVVLL